MKKIFSLLVAAAMVLGATSCQNEAVETPQANEPVSFSATLNATRTELGDGNKVMWNANDKIAVYSQENLNGTVFTGDATEAAATATFTTTEAFTASQTGYLAVYPELKYNTPTYPATGVVPAATYAEGVYSVPVHIGVEQDVVAGGWDEKYNYMVAYSTSNKLAFQAATALLKFTWTGQSNPMGGVTFTAEGANLAGDATLNYNTADGSMSVTTSGDSTQIVLFGLEQGETYYLPLFPGTITGFKFEAYNASWMMEEYLVHDTTLEVKAGKIYNKVGEQTISSPWTLNANGGEMQYSMIIDENNYHVAKNVAWSESLNFYLYDYNVGETFLTASTTVVVGKWQATANDSTGAGFSAPDGELFDIYLSEDASMMCVVAAGEAVPAMPSKYHIYVYNSSEWNPVNLYVWDAGGTTLNGAWPGTAMTTTMVGEVEYYVYDIPNEYIGQTINFIVNNGSAQTADLSTYVEGDVYYYSNGDVVEDPANPVVVASHRIYVKNSAGWSKMYLYGWNGLGTGGWPGVQMTQTEVINGTTYYYYEFTGLGDVANGCIIFNNGSGSQTNDITGVNLNADLFYEVKGTGSNYSKIADPRQ